METLFPIAFAAVAVLLCNTRPRNHTPLPYDQWKYAQDNKNRTLDELVRQWEASNPPPAYFPPPTALLQSKIEQDYDALVLEPKRTSRKRAPVNAADMRDALIAQAEANNRLSRALENATR